MRTLILLAGVAVIALGLIDALVTTSSVSRRAGPLSRVVTACVWRGALAVHRRRPVHGLLSAVGPVLVVLSLLLWMLLLWVGWTLVLGSQDGAVVSSTGKDPVGWMDRFYFAGMALISLGTGDVVGATPGWRVLSVVATGTGMFVLTLSLSYFVSVVGAATQSRAIAAQLVALGRTPQDMVLRTWDGERVSSSLPTVLSDLGQQLSSLRSHVDRVVEVVSRVHVTGASQDAPPPADLTPLRLAGIPVVDQGSYAEAMAHLAPRRRGLEAVVRGAGWSWSEVGTPGESG